MAGQGGLSRRPFPGAPEFELEDGDGVQVKFTTVEEGDTFRKATGNFCMDGKRFFCTYWFPKNDGPASAKQPFPRALVFICHGFAEYINFVYEEVAQNLAAKGILVFGHDHVGHGRTTGSTACYIDTFDELTRPVVGHVRAVQHWEGHEDLPTFLLAHSMGGLISLAVLLIEEQQSLFKVMIFVHGFLVFCKGFIAVGPLVIANPEMATPVMVFLAKILSGIWPSLALTAKADARSVTRDQAVVDRLEADPLMYKGGIRVCMGYKSMLAMDEVGLKMPNLKLPTIIFQGMLDKLVEPSGSRTLFDKISSEDKQIYEYPEAFHNMLVELDEVKKDCLGHIVSWVDRHIPTVTK